MRRSASRPLLAVLAILLATVPAVPRPSAQRIRVEPLPPSSSAWTSWEGEALVAEPIELSLSDEIRTRCAAYPLPPEGAGLEVRKESDSAARFPPELAGLAACLARGPLAGQSLDLFGATDLPGRHAAPVEGGGGADVVRALLARRGVPFSNLVTDDLEMDPTVSPHGAARVVIAVRREEAEP